jgi:hypothetical protein
MIRTIIFDMGKVIIPFDFKRGTIGWRRCARIGRGHSRSG